MLLIHVSLVHLPNSLKARKEGFIIGVRRKCSNFLLISLPKLPEGFSMFLYRVTGLSVVFFVNLTEFGVLWC